MGTKSEPGTYDCFAKAEPDEPMFVLLARDRLAPMLVRMWATLEAGRPDDDLAKVEEARACADAMEVWRKANRRD